MSYYSPTPEENEAYKHLWQVATRGQSSTIGGPDAVKFFVASGLPVPTLKQVWAIASNGQKEMGPREFSTAMRLISIAQSGYPVDENTLRTYESLVCGAPKFQGVDMPTPPPAAMAPPTPTPPAASPNSTGAPSPASWAIPQEQRAGYEKLWGSLQKNPQGLLEGKDAAAFFAKSGQSRETLRTVWQLSDMGGDGMMDQAEFFVGMHLTMMAKKGFPLPSALPQDLVRSASTPFERSASNSSQLSASMMQMMGPSSNSLVGSDNSEKDLMNQSSSKLMKQPSARNPGDLMGASPMPTMVAENSEYESVRQDAVSMNASLNQAVGRMEDARSSIKGQTGRATNELAALRGERERLMQALNEATNAFQSDAEKLRLLDEELAVLREEVGRLRQGVDAKRAAVGAQQDLIGARLDETRALTKQMAGAAMTDANAGQKRRNPPVPPAGGDMFQNSGFPSGDVQQPPRQPPSAFDAFDDAYGMQGSGGKSNEF